MRGKHPPWDSKGPAHGWRTWGLEEQWWLWVVLDVSSLLGSACASERAAVYKVSLRRPCSQSPACLKGPDSRDERARGRSAHSPGGAVHPALLRRLRLRQDSVPQPCAGQATGVSVFIHRYPYCIWCRFLYIHLHSVIIFYCVCFLVWFMVNVSLLFLICYLVQMCISLLFPMWD